MIFLNPLWLPKAFKTGIASIDREHQQLVDTLNDCLKSCDGPDLKDFGIHFENFIADLTSHFEHEVRLMRDAGYPETDMHADHHRICIEKLRRLLERCRAQGHAGHQDVADYFNDMIKFIAKADIQFADFLRDHDIMDEYRTR